MNGFEYSQLFARSQDQIDPLKSFRDEFYFPKTKKNRALYFVGNSLGLQPKKTQQAIEESLEDWRNLAVEGHFHARHPWYSYHEFLTESTARLVGAKPHEVVVMNGLTPNLHFMLISFYRPQGRRKKILIEKGAFPSDRYAVSSHLRLHGLSVEESLIEVQSSSGVLKTEDLLDSIQKNREEIALILIGNVNYLYGQYFDISAITRAGHEIGAKVGFDLAHGAGNLELRLHDDGPDFAVWCSYKYLNAGPGAIAGCFVHERHARNFDLPRLAGWWGHDKTERFKMEPEFKPMEGAEGWQLCNPPILQLAALRASMELFDRAGMSRLRKKSILLTGFLELCLDHVGGDKIQLLTPRDPERRGAHLSICIQDGRLKGRAMVQALQEEGVFSDFREPNVIRLAPAPLYNSFEDVFDLSEVIREKLL